MPGDDFKAEAYFCSKDRQIRIPGDLKEFFEKTATLSGVNSFGTSTSMVLKSSTNAGDNFNITKTDFASGTYKIWSSSDNQRCIYVTSATLAYSQTVAMHITHLYNNLDADMIEDEIEKLVIAISGIAEVLGSCDYQLMEGEMFQHPPAGVNLKLFCEAICNFRSLFYRQVRDQLKQ